MNRLPAVLQKEIWEYVRGDKHHWCQRFSMVMDQLITGDHTIEKWTAGPDSVKLHRRNGRYILERYYNHIEAGSVSYRQNNESGMDDIECVLSEFYDTVNYYRQKYGYP